MAERAFLLGLTGSIGMGKSETAKLFAAAGVPVFDADGAVHALYRDPAVAAEIAAVFPGCAATGSVDRAHLAAALAADPAGFAKLEAVVHPKVGACLKRFLAEARAPLVVLDIPLLYEAGWDALCDAVVAVSAPPAVQKARVMARPGMSETKLNAILARQMPDAEKRRRADFVIEADKGLDDARLQVDRILAKISTLLRNG